jgi:hypothetical protein
MADRRAQNEGVAVNEEWTEDLEQIGRLLPPAAIRAIAEHLARVRSPCQSAIVLDHGPGGRVGRWKTSVTTTVVDGRPPKGVESP